MPPSEKAPEGGTAAVKETPLVEVSRRDFLKWSAGIVGTAGVLGPAVLVPRPSHAFPPDPFFKGVVRMCYHENPWGPHPAAMEAIWETMDWAQTRRGLAGGGFNCFDQFLDLSLKQEILRYNKVDDVLTTDNVVLGLGSAEALFMAADAYSSPDSPFMTEWVAYRIIIQRAEENQANVVKVPLLNQPDPTKQWAADLDTMAQMAAEAQSAGQPYGLIHFNVINNPGGSFLNKDKFRTFADSVYEHAPDTIILCDDSDREYMDPEARPELFRASDDVVAGKKMIHIQTMSHVFGLTGLRVGYALARKDIAEELEARRIFMCTNLLGHRAALASLINAEEQVARVNPLCVESRKRVYADLDALGIPYQNSQGQFISLDLGDIDGTIATLLMYIDKRVFVRWGMEWGLNNWIRMCPSTDYENGQFVSALKWILDTQSLRGVSPADYFGSTEGKNLIQAALRNGFPTQMLAQTGYVSASTLQEMRSQNANQNPMLNMIWS